jgi:hypothetical protein
MKMIKYVVIDQQGQFHLRKDPTSGELELLSTPALEVDAVVSYVRSTFGIETVFRNVIPTSSGMAAHVQFDSDQSLITNTERVWPRAELPNLVKEVIDGIVSSEILVSNRIAPAALAPRTYIFVSFDIVGSTAFKQKQAYQTVRPRDVSPWINPITLFYRKVDEHLKSSVIDVATKLSEFGMDHSSIDLRIWKAIGDEIVFCGEIEDRHEVLASCVAAVRTAKRLNKDLSEFGLSVKASAWMINTPYPNREVVVGGSGAPEGRPLVANLQDLSIRSDFLHTSAGPIDFVGP